MADCKEKPPKYCDKLGCYVGRDSCSRCRLNPALEGKKIEREFTQTFIEPLSRRLVSGRIPSEAVLKYKLPEDAIEEILVKAVAKGMSAEEAESIATKKGLSLVEGSK